MSLCGETNLVPILPGRLYIQQPPPAMIVARQPRRLPDDLFGDLMVAADASQEPLVAHVSPPRERQVDLPFHLASHLFERQFPQLQDLLRLEKILQRDADLIRRIDLTL